MTQPVVKIVLDTREAEQRAAAFAAKLNSTVGGGAAGATRLQGALNGVSGSIVQTGGAAQRLAQSLNAANNNASAGVGLFGKLKAALSGVAGQATSLGTSFAGLGGLAVAGGIAAIGTAAFVVGSQMADATAKVQAYKASLTTIIGDAGKASQAFNALASFAAKTPFTLDQAVNGFVKLKALGLKPTEEALTSYGNTSAAMGKTLEQMVEAVADATTGEFERLKEFGIKSKQQGDSVSFTFQNVTTKVKKSSEDIQNFLIGIGNTKFAGGMERQAATISGAISSLSDNIFLAFAKMGEGGFATALTKIITSLATGLQTVQPVLVGIGQIIGGILNFAAETVTGITSIFGAITGEGSGSITLMQALGATFNVIGQTVGVVGDLIGSAFRGVANVISWVTGGLRSMFGDAFGWLTGITPQVAGSVGLSFVGILRSVKFVAGAIPQLFAAAFEDVKKLFGSLGSIVSRLLSGDLSALKDVGSAFATSFKSSAGVMDGIVAKASKIASDTKGNQAALDRLTGRGKSTSKIDDFAGGSVVPGASAAGSGKDKKDKDAAAAAQRAKSIEEYWKTLNNAVDASKLLPLEAEKLTKWQELQKLYGDKLTEQDKAALEAAKGKIAAKLQEIALNKSITDMRETTRKLDNENLITAQKRTGLSEVEQKIEDALASRRVDALNAGATLADLATETWKADEQRLATALRTKGVYDAQAAALGRLKDISAKYSPDAERQGRLDAIATDRKDYLKAAEAQGISKGVQASVLRGMADAERSIGNEARVQFSDTISDLASQFGGKFGSVIQGLAKGLQALTQAAGGKSLGTGLLGSIANLIGKDSNGNNNAIGDAVSKANASMLDQLTGKAKLGGLKDGLNKMGSDIKGLFTKGGDFTKSLGSVLGNAGAGAQIGSMTAQVANPLLKAIGLKTSNTGAQIGGAIGGLTGNPLIAAAASVVGSIVGGLFKKTKKGSATIGFNGYGNLDTTSLTGNSSKMKEAASGAAGSVISGLQTIADALGGELTGTPSVSIGLRDGKYRVDTTGSGKTKKSSTVKDFGKDGAEDAIAYAIQDALKDGVLTGISAFSAQVLKSATDIDAATKIAANYENVLKELRSIDDPIAGIVESITKPIDALRKSMVKLGASTADLNNVDRYRTEMLKKAKDEQLATLRDLQDGLFGTDTGVSALDQLTAKLGALTAFEADLSSGKTIDQDAFSKTVEAVKGLAGDVYGTSTSQAQDIFARLNSDVAKALQVTGDNFDAKAQADQLTAQTAVLSDQLGQAVLTNDYLRQITEMMAANGAAAIYGGSTTRAVNGQYVSAY